MDGCPFHIIEGHGEGLFSQGNFFCKQHDFVHVYFQFQLLKTFTYLVKGGGIHRCVSPLTIRPLITLRKGHLARRVLRQSLPGQRGDLVLQNLSGK